MDVCTAIYFNAVNDDMFETFLRTFRRVSGALLQVYTDTPKKKWENDYQVEFVRVKPEEYRNKRCLCRMECVQHCLSRLKDGDRLVCSDVDVYYLDDPFTAFDKLYFDIGVTRRFHPYKVPINSGQFFIRANPTTRYIFDGELVDFARKHPEWHDWYLDQEFLIDLWRKGDAVDVGWEYNFCPNTDVFGVEMAQGMIRRAYGSRSVKVLHLKSELMLCLYNGYMEDAVTKNPCGSWNWKKDGDTEQKH